MSQTIDGVSFAVRPEDHAQGPAQSKLLLVEYGDFQCPTCKQAAPAVDLLLEQFAGRVQYVYRHYPLEQIHPQALAAAEAAESAGAQGQFWAMHRVLFDHQQNLQLPDLARYAADIGLDMKRYEADMAGHLHLARVRGDIALGDQAHVRATPGFFLNGHALDVSFGMRSLHDAIERGLA